MKNIISVVLNILVLSCWVNVNAQERQVNISLGGGLQPIQYETKVGEVYPGGGFLFLCQYQQFFNKHLGFGVGLDIDFYNSATEIDEVFESEIDNPEVGSPYTLRTIFDNWKEKQSILMAELPVGLYGNIQLSRTTNLIIGAGVKVGIPVIAKYSIKEGAIETRAYFGESIDAELSDIPHHGLFVDDKKDDGDVETNTLCTSFYADMMFTFSMNDATRFHCGFYFSQGLTDLSNSHDSFEGNNYNGILNSDLTEKCVPMSIGAKIGFSIIPSKNSRRGSSGTW